MRFSSFFKNSQSFQKPKIANLCRNPRSETIKKKGEKEEAKKPEAEEKEDIWKMVQQLWASE